MSSAVAPDHSAPEIVFEHWRTVMGHPRAQLDDKRRRVIRAALKFGYTPEQLCQAVDGCKLTPHNMGQNDRHEIYDSLGLILRDADHVDRFCRNATTSRATVIVDTADAERQAYSDAVVECYRRQHGNVIDLNAERIA